MPKGLPYFSEIFPSNFLILEHLSLLSTLPRLRIVMSFGKPTEKLKGKILIMMNSFCKIRNKMSQRWGGSNLFTLRILIISSALPYK